MDVITLILKMKKLRLGVWFNSYQEQGAIIK